MVGDARSICSSPAGLCIEPRQIASATRCRLFDGRHTAYWHGTPDPLGPALTDAVLADAQRCLPPWRSFRRLEQAMKNPANPAVATSCLTAAATASAQNGPMAEGGAMSDGTWMRSDGGFWVPALLAALVGGLVVWFIMQKGN